MKAVTTSWLAAVFLSSFLLNAIAHAEQTEAEKAGFTITPDIRAAMKMRGTESPKAWLGNAIRYNYHTDPLDVEVGQKYRLPEARKQCAAGDADSCATARDIEKWLAWARSAPKTAYEKCDRSPCDRLPGNLVPPALKGKPWILHAWASWCPYCGLDHLRLVELNAGKRMQLVSLVYQDSESAAAQYLASHRNPYNNGSISASSGLLKSLDLHNVPATFVIGPDGNVVQRFIGTLGSEGQKALEEYFLR